jgi:hypothetical protein
LPGCPADPFGVLLQHGQHPFVHSPPPDL